MIIRSRFTTGTRRALRLVAVSLVAAALSMACAFIPCSYALGSDATGGSTVQAQGQNNRVNSLNMDVTLLDDGAAQVQATWQTQIYSGTEFFVPMGVKGVVKNLVVREGDVTFANKDPWDVDVSREEKTHKSGIHSAPSEDELCWGVGQYGNHTFQVSYRIENFLRQTTDGQYVLFWKFINDHFNLPIGQATVHIRAASGLDKDKSRIWAFGFRGQTRINDDGSFTVTSTASLAGSNFLTVLARAHPLGLQSAQKVDQSFAQILDKAREGSDYEQLDPDAHAPGPVGEASETDSTNTFNMDPNYDPAFSGSSGGVSGGFGGLLPQIENLLPFAIGALALAFPFLVNRSKKKQSPTGMRTWRGYNPNKKFQTEFWRQIPFEGDFALVLDTMKDINPQVEQSLVSAYLLRWLRDGALVSDRQAQLEGKSRFFMDPARHQGTNYSPADRELFTAFYQAAGDDAVLDEKEMKRWAKKARWSIKTWVESQYTASQKYLQNNGYYEPRKHLVFNYLQPSQKGEDLQGRIVGFKRYLQEFSLLSERPVQDVALWSDMLIWAAYLGIADQVYQDLAKIYPDFVTELPFDYEQIYWLNTVSQRVALAYAATQANEAYSFPASSGLGGMSSFGGGGGSFGGGSGGGVR